MSDPAAPKKTTKPTLAVLECHAPALKLDASAYRHFLEETDWTEAQKDEFTQALWQIIVAALDLNFGIHPIQLVMDSPKVLDVDSQSMLIFEEHSEIKDRQDATTAMAGPAAGEDS
jgi:hypothetical protein